MKLDLLNKFPRGKSAVWFLSGVTTAIVVTVAATTGESLMPGEETCALTDAMKEAINKKIQVLGMTSPDPSKYFTIGGSDSCLGSFTTTNIDLSRLIPDPMGVMTDGITSAIDGIKDAAIKKVCTAARNSIGDVIGKYNTAIQTVNGASATDLLIDSSIGGTVKDTLDKYALNWNVTSGSTDVLSGVTLPASGTTSSSGSTSSSGVSVLPSNGTNSTSYTVAAANLESARQTLANAKSYAASVSSTSSEYEAAQSRLAAAQVAYGNALTAYNAAQSAVITGSSTTSSTSATTGGSVF